METCCKCRKRPVWIKKHRLCKTCYHREFEKKRRVRVSQKKSCAEMTFEEIGAELKVPTATVHLIYNRAIAKLSRQPIVRQLFFDCTESGSKQTTQTQDTYATDITHTNFYDYTM